MMLVKKAARLRRSKRRKNIMYTAYTQQPTYNRPEPSRKTIALGTDFPRLCIVNMR